MVVVSLPNSYILGDVLAAEIHVERDKLPDEMRFRGTVAQVLNRVDGGQVVGAGRVQGNAQRGHPPLQQRNQIVQERVVGVGRVCDRLEAPQRAMARPHVVLEHPKVAALHRLGEVFAVVALDQCPGGGWRERDAKERSNENDNNIIESHLSDR